MRHASLPLSFLLAVGAPAGAADLTAARDALAAQDLPTAAVLLKTALQADPNDAAARLLLAQAHLDALQPVAARAELTRIPAGGTPGERERLLAQAWLMELNYANALEAVAAADAGEADSATLKARALAGLGRTGDARTLLNAVLSQAPNHVGALVALAELSAAGGALDVARAHAQAALEQDPDHWPALDVLGVIEQRAGDLAAAEAALDAAIAAAPTDWPLQYKRALVRIQRNNLAAAAADLAAIEAAAPAVPLADLLRARLRLAEGDLDAADRQFADLRQRFPEDVETAVLYADALNRSGRYGLAKGQVIGFADAPDAPPQVRFVLARAHLGLREFDAAEAQLLGLGDDPAALGLLAEVYQAQGLDGRAEAVQQRLQSLDLAAQAVRLLAAGDAAAARDLLLPLLDTERPPRGVMLLLVRTHLLTGQPALATALGERLAREWPDDAEAQAALGSALGASRDFDGARAAFTRALALDDRSARALIGLSTIALASGDAETARAYARQAVALEPDNAGVNRLLGLLGDESAPRAIEQQLRAVLQGAPEDRATRLELARLLLEAKRAAEALTLLDAAPPAQQADPNLLRWRALAQLQAGDPAASLATIARLPAPVADALTIRWLRARAHAAAGQVEPLATDVVAVLTDPAGAALPPALLGAVLAELPTPAQRDAALAAIAAAAPDLPAVLLLQAQAAAAAGDYAAVAAHFGRLAELRPADPQPVVARAAALSQLGQAAAGREALSAWLRAHPDADAAARAVISRAIAASLLESGDYPAAIPHYRDVVAADPKDGVARNNLAMLLKDTAPAEALGFAREARALMPEEPDVADTLGQVLLANGDLPAAVASFTEAHQRADNPQYGLHLAEALTRQGDIPAARDLLTRLAAAPSDVQAQAARLLAALPPAP